MAELNGRTLSEDATPEFPEELRYLFDWYLTLRMGLGTDMMGLAPVSWVALDAWSRHTGNAPNPGEVEALFYLDAVFRNPDPKAK